MVRVRHSVEIRANPEDVFALVTDVARKARLNPNTQVIRVGKETDGPVGEQTVFHYVLRQGAQIIDYRSRCVAFEPERMMETVSLTDPSFSVRVTVEPTAEGVRLTQEESFEFPPPPRPPVEPEGLMGLLANLVVRIFGDRSRHQGQALPADEARIEVELETRLAAWLDAVKVHLESHRSRG